MESAWISLQGLLVVYDGERINEAPTIGDILNDAVGDDEFEVNAQGYRLLSTIEHHGLTVLGDRNGLLRK